MSKRSHKKFKRVTRDFYPTPREAVEPLIKHFDIMGGHTHFVEPCAGDGALASHLESAGMKCVEAWDIKPQGANIIRRDARFGEVPLIKERPDKRHLVITNPPFLKEMRQPIMENLIRQTRCWFLLPADYMHNKSSWLMHYCDRIIPVGRVSWFGEMLSMDNFCWYLFDNDESCQEIKPLFYPRSQRVSLHEAQ